MTYSIIVYNIDKKSETTVKKNVKSLKEAYNWIMSKIKYGMSYSVDWRFGVFNVTIYTKGMIYRVLKEKSN